MSATMSKGARMQADLTALLRARHSLLWLLTREEVRVERMLTEAANAAGYVVQFWDCVAGITDAAGKTVDGNMRDPTAAIANILASDARVVWCMRDLHRWFDPVVLRALRNAARALQVRPKDKAAAIVILTPSGEVPPELAGHATVIEAPLPDRSEIAVLFDDVLRALPETLRAEAAPNGVRDAAIDAAVGLSAEEAANCYAKSLVTNRRIDPVAVGQEKKRVIARERVLTWIDPDPRGMEAVGGLDVLKDWLRARRAGFSVKAREFGLPAPKGCMLIGVPGCGKSLTAKCIASAWGIPLLRLDPGAVKSKYVGESESNLRRALAVAEAVSPAVLWIDELEKAMSGATGPQGDGGVAADSLAAILNWMQERAGAVFVVATANDVRALPPELLRKGRFDEVFWIDLPTRDERAAIAIASMRERGRALTQKDAETIALATVGFTGSEIAACVPDAMFVAFEQQREVTAADVVAAASTVVPLSKTASEKIEGLRQWAKGRARPASTPVTETQTPSRSLDLG